MYRIVPQAFVPEEDQGYFISIVQAPAGASLQYTGEIARQAEQILLKDPEVLGVFSVMGFSFSGAAPNQGLIFTSLKPFAEREGAEHSAQTVINRICGQFAGISGANVFPTLPASIPGLGAFGGFEFQVLDQGGTDINALAERHLRDGGGGQPVAEAARAVHLLHRRTIRSSRSRSIATAPWRSGCRSARSRARCRSTSARST